MPELPDVESLKRYFQTTSLNQKITGVQCDDDAVLAGTTSRHLDQRLSGKVFETAHRRGKFLVAGLNDGQGKVVFHFGMTGDLHYGFHADPRDGLDRYTRVAFQFDNGYELRWINMRKLGRIHLVTDPNDIPLIRDMGPEPLDMSEPEFLEILKSHPGKNLKSMFLDQRIIAGIGNVYADEILFRARLSPHRKVGTLSTGERAHLYEKMIEVLNEAIRVRPPRGMLFGALWLLPQRQGGLTCPRTARHRLKRETIAGRTTVYCPVCQEASDADQSRAVATSNTPFLGAGRGGGCKGPLQGRQTLSGRIPGMGLERNGDSPRAWDPAVRCGGTD